MSEKQLLRYVKKARRASGSTGQVLLQQLEMRLDNTIFRLGMGPTIPAARQVVNHGHITVNGRVVSIPSYQCRPGDVIVFVPKTFRKSWWKQTWNFLVWLIFPAPGV